MLSYQGGIRVASYTACKSGLARLNRLPANEWAAKGINVNAIAPGYFEISNTTALRADEDRSRDILASSASDDVHGSLLAVDGGWLAR